MHRVIARNLRGGRRPDLAIGCSEKLNREFMVFLRYVWTFDRDYRPKIENQRLLDGPQVPVLHLNGKSQIRDFLKSYHSTR
ncbi:MAG: hypothetical protein QM656_12660 [Paracoccaceae bacterium]